MAKWQGKKVSSSVPHKSHGPKQHRFKELKPMIHVFAKCGILTKYYNRESFEQACAAKGMRVVDASIWRSFSVLSFEDKKKWFKETFAKSTNA